MKSEESYRIAVEPVSGRVKVTVAGDIVADCDDASVMHETYLPSHVYFPKSALTEGILQPSPLRTFCPFKGTAHHWHLRLPNQTLENGAWSYETPLNEASAIKGHVAFYPNVIEELTSERQLPAAAPAQVAGSPLINWLMREAWLCRTPAELTEKFAESLLSLGMPLWRLNVNVWTLHPLLVGKRFTWQRDKPGVSEGETPQGVLQQPAYLNSPVRHVSEGRGGVRQRLDTDDPEFRFPIMEDLRAQGGTDYVAMPLFFSDGQIQTMTLASDHPDGFSTSHLGQVFESITALSRFFEVLTLRHDTAVLFNTYLGERTGQKVLGGSTHRGDGEDIRSAILFCDLRDSTSMAGSMSRERYLHLLNDFFEQATEPVVARGGEVLKFIGDAVLAIFPLESGEDEDLSIRDTCGRAREAAEAILARVATIPTGEGSAPLHCSIGLHVGDVMYGNVGAPARLDFTVIGSAANIAARLSAQCKTLGRSLLISADVARHAPENLESLGKQTLRNVAHDVEVFGVRS